MAYNTSWDEDEWSNVPPPRRDNRPRRGNGWIWIVVVFIVIIALLAGVLFALKYVQRKQNFYGYFVSESGDYAVSIEKNGFCNWYQNDIRFEGTYYKRDSSLELEIEGSGYYSDTTFLAVREADGYRISGGTVKSEFFAPEEKSSRIRKLDDEPAGVRESTTPAATTPAPAPTTPATVATEPPTTETTLPSDYIAELSGHWSGVHLVDGNSNLNVSAYVFNDGPVYCRQMTINMLVTMNAGTNCKDWNLWGRVGGEFKKLEKLYLPDGDGFGSQTVYFDTPVYLDAVVVTPTIPGGYSWSLGLSVTDVWLG